MNRATELQLMATHASHIVEQAAALAKRASKVCLMHEAISGYAQSIVVLADTARGLLESEAKCAARPQAGDAVSCPFTAPLRADCWRRFDNSERAYHAQQALSAAEAWLETRCTADEWALFANFHGVEFQERDREGYAFRLRGGVEMTLRGSWESTGYMASGVEWRCVASSGSPQ